MNSLPLHVQSVDVPGRLVTVRFTHWPLGYAAGKLNLRFHWDVDTSICVICEWLIKWQVFLLFMFDWYRDIDARSVLRE